MPRNKFGIYPRARALAILCTGETRAVATTLNRALEIFADSVARAAREAEESLSKQEYCLFADIFNGSLVDSTINIKQLILAQVRDADELEGAGAKWGVDAKKLLAKIEKLSEPACYSILLAVEFFWANYEKLDVRKSPWNLLETRRKELSKIFEV